MRLALIFGDKTIKVEARKDPDSCNVDITSAELESMQSDSTVNSQALSDFVSALYKNNPKITDSLFNGYTDIRKIKGKWQQRFGYGENHISPNCYLYPVTVDE